LIATDDGTHVTDVDVDRFVTVRPNVPELIACVVEPPYAPVIVCVPKPTDGV